MKRRIYLDHAATSFPKLRDVLDAMHEYSLHREASAGRGVYRASIEAGKIVRDLRAEIAGWVGASSAGEVSLQSGGTAALNVALLGLIRPGDHVVTGSAEHNSVLRPLQFLAEFQDVSITIVPVDASGTVQANDVLDAVTETTRMVVMTHATNVNGAVQPIEEIGRSLTAQTNSESKPILMIDAAQSFGYLPLHVRESFVDVLAAPGHKGGHGPLGTGFLYVDRRLHDQIRPSVFGGTGSHSDSIEMPTEFPGAFEAGNLNVPAYAGWLAGLRSYRNERTAWETLTATSRQMQARAEDLYRRLGRVKGIRIVGRPAELRLPIASLEIESMSAVDAAAILDAEFGIEVRSGFHCAALIHHAIESPSDGTLRISCGPTTTDEDLDCLESALKQLT